ncbi:sugar ABC transporter substrate-binding protein [Streptomyces botrytidirepellens]|uniref:Extracellular solute-binding protein n=1 Tax=Streptomyces botrytidirepellens TaxID=2486417 RepID=A0A3M8WVY2_9ACTN|nr:extracellular solute-binding protein [Streptomyces botrytidirepellens]RNG34328.1 extracellular solute-binding protein [Streptomyces botrytidirepellens]
MNIKRAARRGSLAALAAVTAVAVITGCSSSEPQSAAGDGTGTIQIWSHQGQEAEVAAIKAAVNGFNSSQSKVKASLRLIPGDTYTQTITNTPADKLPDVMDIDGPTLASFAYNKRISPLSDYVSKATIDNATAGSIAEGTYDHKLYGLAQFDSAIGLYGNKKLLAAAGVPIPTSSDQAWTTSQFADVLKKVAAVSPSGKAIDLRESGLSGEWGIYAFSPLIYSAGGGILKDNKASGALNSAASVKALKTFASWKPYVASSPDGKAFPDGKVGLQWSGHWLYPDNSKALGKNLVALPLPNLGDGAKSGVGSWTWGIGAGTKNGKAAGAFLDYLLSDTSVNAMVKANGAPPATKSAFADASLYKTGGALALWGKQLAKACAADKVTSDCAAIYRPVTPGYPTVTAKFGSALSAIYGGADPKTELTNAARAIDSNFADNSNYK